MTAIGFLAFLSSHLHVGISRVWGQKKSWASALGVALIIELLAEKVHLCHSKQGSHDPVGSADFVWLVSDSCPEICFHMIGENGQSWVVSQSFI